MPKGWNYQRIDENGRLKSYYGIGQEWTFSERGRQHSIKVKHFTCNENGVQYYWIAIDGRLKEERLSAARLHYLLNSKQAVEVSGGSLMPLPLLKEEVENYFAAGNYTDCEVCGGYGIDVISEKICRCACKLTYEIKAFNAEQRKTKLFGESA